MFNDEQLSFITDKSKFLLKNEVDSTVNKLLYKFQNSLSDLIDQSEVSFPTRLRTRLSKLPNKVTKGNNLKGFPFQVSDYPSVFNGDDIFSFRSVIWYGNFFSFNLILSGKSKENHSIDVKNLLDKGYQLVTNESIWQMELKKGSSSELGVTADAVEKCQGFRLFKVYDLNQIHDFERLGVECFKELFSVN